MGKTGATLLPPPFKSGDAPFVYFDAAPAYGTLHGGIEVELIARILVPNFTGGPTTTEIVPTARLRCSPAAAVFLIEALRLALELMKKGEEQGSAAVEAAAATKLN